jgi:hypothetical protein
MSSNKLIQQKVKQLTLSYLLMIVGLILYIINGEGLWLLAAATLFIYLPVFLKMYGMSGNISKLGSLLNGSLTVLIIFGEMLSIFGVLAAIFGLFISVLFNSISYILIFAIPLLLSAFLYLRVSFGLKKGKEIRYSYGLLLVIFIGLILLVLKNN